MGNINVIDIEGNLIALLLKHPKAIYDMKIDKTFFGNNQHKAFFSIMEYLSETRDIDNLEFDPPTLATLCHKKKELGVVLDKVFKDKTDTIEYLKALKEFEVSIKNLDIYEEKLIKAKLTNELVNTNKEVIKDIQDNYEDYSKEEIVDKLEENVLQVSNSYVNKENNIEHISEGTWEMYDKRKPTENSYVGLPTPFSTLNKLTKGILRPGSVSLINAQTGVGKSIILKQIVKKIAIDYGKCVYFGANEMNIKEQKDRLLAEMVGISPEEIERAVYNKKGNEKVKEKVMTKVDELMGGNIYFDQIRGFTPEMLVRRAKFFKKRYDIDLFVWDYVKLSSGKPRGEEMRVYLGRIVNMMKENIADPLEIPVLSACQSKTYEWYMPCESENIRRNCTCFVSVKEKDGEEKNKYPIGDYKMYVGKNRFGQAHSSPDDECIPLDFDKSNLKFYEV